MYIKKFNKWNWNGNWRYSWYITKLRSFNNETKWKVNLIFMKYSLIISFRPVIDIDRKLNMHVEFHLLNLYIYEKHRWIEFCKYDWSRSLYSKMNIHTNIFLVDQIQQSMNSQKKKKRLLYLQHLNLPENSQKLNN
jgi:hypothetical protein